MVIFEAQSLATLRNDQHERQPFRPAAGTWVATEGSPYGGGFSRFPQFLSQHHPADWVNVEPCCINCAVRKKPTSSV